LFGDANDDKLFVAGMVPLSNFGPEHPQEFGASFLLNHIGPGRAAQMSHRRHRS
jgi:hypothetical protein